MSYFKNYLNRIKDTLSINDRALHLPNFLPNKNDIITWQDVEHCLNNPSLYDIEIIDKNSSTKIALPTYKKHFINSSVMEHYHLIDLFNQGNSAVILNYGQYNRSAADLLKNFEEAFFVSSAIHVYCGLEGSQSFNIHEDFPCNFIIQIEGNTRWKVFNNRVSQLFSTRGYDRAPNEDELETTIDVILTPGDALYIPARAYHVAMVSEPRLSISIPCWSKMDLDPLSIVDRNFYKINIK
jgi:hypothetical protein